MDPAEIDELVDAGRAATDVVIVPDRHGTGTNALVLDPVGPVRAAVRPGLAASATCEQARAAAACATSSTTVASLALDVDTGDDLDELLARARQRSHGRAPRTRGVLRQIERTRSRAAGRLECRCGARLSAEPLAGLPEVRRRATTSRQLIAAAADAVAAIGDGDVVVVAQKVVSKAEGRRAQRSRECSPRERARELAAGSARTRGSCRWCSTRAPRCCAPSAAC